MNKSNDSKVSPKTILHLIDTTGPGGAETVFIQLADRLRNLGYRSVVVVRGPGWVEQTLRQRGLTPHVIPAKGSFAIGFLIQLVKLIRQHKVDLIQSHLLGSNVYGALAGLITGTPVVATYHGMVDINPNERFKALKHAAMRAGIKHYVTVSERLKENVLSQNLLRRERTSIIYNGVDLSRFQLSDSGELKQRLQLPGNAILIGALGNIRPAKAYDNLIAAGADLVKRHPEVHFIIAGHQKASLMKKLEQQLIDQSVTAHFHFIGFIDDSANFLAQLDIFALSSSSEGFSIATIEAMAAELPMVVTRCGGPEEIVQPEKNALMVEPHDPKAFADALDRLITDKELRARLAIAGRRHVEKTFSLETMLQQYHTRYQQLIS